MTDLLLYDSTERSAALRHEVPVAVLDPFLYAEVGGRGVVLTTMIERDRIGAARPDVELLDLVELGLWELVDAGMEVEAAAREVAVRAVQRLAVTAAIVPADFPVALADRLRAEGVALTVDDAAVTARRRAKAPHELDGIRAAQRAAEAGMAAAAALLARAEPGPGGRLVIGGEHLTAERVRAALRAACAEHGATCPPDVIVASVWDGIGHEPGSGPLPAGLPVQVDLWPRDEATGCWADMTRTFVVGEPPAEAADVVAAQEEVVRAVLEEVRAAVRPGVLGRRLHDLACERFEAAGHRTQRTAPADDRRPDGFRFALGHGVGLDVHEAPSLGLAGHDPLVAGDVVAIEPGLWDERFGGVRFEDLLVVTDDGAETLTRYPYALTPAP